MRICAACRQPLDRDERDHDCPADADKPEDADEEDMGAA